ncbi:tyrosine recombinase XerC [Trichococcus ilyis]|uniref:Tyrosine recombinase XerC n=1 Tax=Trichococcus ilyis TaxID=640938 RepID=A0A143Y7L6_9LACT|nr:tyrosine recombinase XerC [Trichococcus ilyis]CZQ81500.1 integrase catalytic [Trichococcus ilyis]SEI52827.1 integrase/recombinase XerC [Trichococcus ilyis]
MSNQELVDRFINYLAVERRYSDETVKAYVFDLQKFESFLQESGNSDFLAVQLYDVRLYLSFLDEQKLSRNTISRTLSSLRGFYHFLIRNDYVDENPLSYISFKKKQLRLPQYLYEEELEKLLGAAEGTQILDYRNRALVELLYATGIRVSECKNIKLQDVSFDLGVILVFGKSNKERYVPFGHYAAAAIQEYLEMTRPELMSKYQRHHDYLFVNRLGDPLTAGGIEYILKQVMKKTGLTGSLHPHMLRHTFATDMLNNGADMRTVQELLGHASLSSTQIYTHVTKDALQRNYNQFHPRAKRESNNRGNNK